MVLLNMGLKRFVIWAKMGEKNLLSESQKLKLIKVFEFVCTYSMMKKLVNLNNSQFTYSDIVLLSIYNIICLLYSYLLFIQL